MPEKSLDNLLDYTIQVIKGLPGVKGCSGKLDARLDSWEITVKGGDIDQIAEVIRYSRPPHVLLLGDVLRVFPSGVITGKKCIIRFNYKE